ncbi:uncharacterized protein VTP21DRAFT_8566 [Calcarisporiella thermophila]|uniref:uncharacterized protein n=1 Tax=Calcarisporiella thermophila TaxID=911321 RepID=UPI003743D147
MDASKITRIVFIALVLDILAFTIILPLFPRLIHFYNFSEDKSWLLEWSLKCMAEFRRLVGRFVPVSSSWDTVLLGGALGSLFSFLQFLISPVIGSLSDRWGRRTVLLFSMLGNIASSCLWMTAKTFERFVLARVVGGLSEGNVQLSIAIVSDVTTKETRSRAVALVGIAFAISFTIGPAIGAYFASKDISSVHPKLIEWGFNPYSTSALISLILLIIEIMFIYIFLPETANISRKQESGSSKSTEKHPQLSATEKNKRIDNLRVLSALHFAFLFIFSGMEFTITFLTFDLFDFTHMQQGKLLGFIGILSSLFQGGYVRRRAHSVGEKRVALQGMASCALALACIAGVAAFPSLGLLYTGAALLAFTSASVVTCLTALASLQCDGLQSGAEDGRKGATRYAGAGSTLGKFRSWGQLGRALGPIAACSLYWLQGPMRCYGIGSLSMALIASLFSRVLVDIDTKKKKNV